MPDRRFLIALFFVALTAVTALPATAQMTLPPGTKLIILRHADRVNDDLTAKGHARAQALVHALAKMHIDAIYAPGLKRNLDTAAPLAKARGLPITRIPASNPTQRLLAKGGGKTIVWIGNKGNLATIWKDLNAPGSAPLTYGDLFIVTPGPTGPKVSRHRFGP